MDFKRLVRNKLTVVTVLLAVLLIVLVIMQSDRNGAPPGEVLVEPIAQSARQIGNMPVNQGGASGVQSALIRQSPQPGQQREMRMPEQPVAVIPVNGAMMQARLIHKVDPVYPEIAGVNHTVKLRVITDENGMVAEISVNSGNQVSVEAAQMFAEAAVEAVSQWRYLPALVDGIPVPASFNVDVFFGNNETVVTSSLAGVYKLSEHLPRKPYKSTT